jgi:HSP20 family protein
LPGVKKEDVKIEVENNTLRIQGERKGEEKKDEVKRHYSEVFYGSFIRDYNLPNTVNSNNIKARYVDGVLNITIPKSPESKAQTIKIE